MIIFFDTSVSSCLRAEILLVLSLRSPSLRDVLVYRVTSTPMDAISSTNSFPDVPGYFFTLLFSTGDYIPRSCHTCFAGDCTQFLPLPYYILHISYWYIRLTASKSFCVLQLPYPPLQSCFGGDESSVVHCWHSAGLVACLRHHIVTPLLVLEQSRSISNHRIRDRPLIRFKYIDATCI